MSTTIYNFLATFVFFHLQKEEREKKRVFSFLYFFLFEKETKLVFCEAIYMFYEVISVVLEVIESVRGRETTFAGCSSAAQAVER